MRGMTRDEWNAYCMAEAAGDSETVKAIFAALEGKAEGGRTDDLGGDFGDRNAGDDSGGDCPGGADKHKNTQIEKRV